MGLKLRYHLFHGVDHGVVFQAYSEFYEDYGHPLQVVIDPQPKDRWHELLLHERDGDWTVLDSPGAWELDIRRKAQLHVSRVLNAAGLMVYVCDGDFWLYELFANGVVLDQFTQDPWEAKYWFPNRDSRGNPLLLTQQFPWVKPEDAATYLMQEPIIIDDNGEEAIDWAEYERLDVPARPGDEFNRFDECAVIDFLRLLGIRLELRNHYVTLLSPIWRTLRIASDPWLTRPTAG